MREGSLDAPTRHPIPWQDPAYSDPEKLDAEMDRVFDICHGCRRCFNLCDSFPKLFDLVDNSPTGELDGVDRKDYRQVVDACTLCDMCYMVSCPYVPPHEFNLDFPHLMLQFRHLELQQGRGVPVAEKQLAKTDRNGRLATVLPGPVNWANRTGNALTRPVMEKVAGVDADARLPVFSAPTFEKRAKKTPAPPDRDAPGAGRKAVLYATCFVNYNTPQVGDAARAVLAKNGVETEVAYPQCCGSPQLEQGDFEAVAAAARKVTADLGRWVDDGYDIVALTPSCALMLKFKWPLILPDDAAVTKVARATYDLSEYVVDIAGREGLAGGMKPLDGGVSLHVACHARAQNMGVKGREMLKFIPGATVKALPRCSGHGGTWGVMADHFETAMKVGKPVARDAYRAENAYLASECPLAAKHIVQGIERIDADTAPAERKAMPGGAYHPIQLLAMAYGIEPGAAAGGAR